MPQAEYVLFASSSFIANSLQLHQPLAFKYSLYLVSPHSFDPLLSCAWVFRYNVKQ
jgi:hypothetical protein